MEVSWSKIKTWRRCQAAYAYKYVEGLVPKRRAVQLLRGSIIGECLDVRAEMHPGKDLHWNEVLDRYYKEYRRVIAEDPEQYGSLINDCANIMMRYTRQYEDEKLTYWAPPKGKPYEHRVEVELMPDVTFIGYIDKIPEDERGRFWIMDHKSHKKLPDENDRFVDLQLVFYSWAAPLSGLPKPAGVIWDYVRTKLPAVPEVLKSGELSKRKDIDTDEATYRTAIRQNGLREKDYADILAIIREKGTNRFFNRVQLPSPNKDLVRNVVNDARVTASEIMHLGGKARTRHMNMTCKQCQYFALCQAEVRGLDAGFIRETEYTVKERDDARQEEGAEAESE